MAKDWSKRWEGAPADDDDHRGILSLLFRICLVGIVAFVFYGMYSHRDDPPDPLPVKQENPADDLSVANLEWSREGFGSVLVADITISNQGRHDLHDIELTCSGKGASGTVINKRHHTIYDIVPARGQKRFREVNLGFFDPQVRHADCIVTGAQLP